MSNPTISQIKVGDGVVYDLCDKSARNTISLVNTNFVDIMNSQSPNYGWGDHSLIFKDSLGNPVGKIGSYSNTYHDKKVSELAFCVTNPDQPNSTSPIHQQNFVVGLAADGSTHVRGTSGMRRAWEDWLGLGSYLEAIQSESVTIDNNTYTTLTEVSLPTGGIWLLLGSVMFISGNNLTGERLTCIASASADMTKTAQRDQVLRLSGSRVNPTGNASHYTIVHTSAIALFSSANVTYRLMAHQNSGSSLTAQGTLRAAKLGY